MALQDYKDLPNFYTCTHPLLKHKLSLLRDINTSKKKFKELVHEITIMLAYEATSDLALTTRKIQTPLESFDAPVLDGKKPLLLPILRAGLGMVDGFLSLMPGARVGHIGLFRDEDTLQPQLYYYKIPPDSSNRQVYVIDPMLATGGSAADAISKIKESGLRNIKMVCLVAAPEGVQALVKKHGDIKIYAASLDRELNDNGYILPGLGDAGDRLFGTR